MQIVQGTINDRKVLYFDIKDNLNEIEKIELESWGTYVIADDVSHPLLVRYAEMAIDKNLLYMSATGKVGSEIDDLFDSLIVQRENEGMNLPIWYRDKDDVLMTTWHDDFEEGYWFITSVARYEDFPIKAVVVVNFTQISRFEEIQDLTVRIRSGQFP